MALDTAFFEGVVGVVNRYVLLNKKLLDPRIDLVTHSISGELTWGYPGRGPAQLALAMLCAVYDDDIALLHHEQYKEQVIAHMPPNKPWFLSAAEVQRVVDDIRGKREF
ncbi:hypothetical protein BJI67_16165 (plasmid) [Acidihalobacter aeolianus]|uniref:Uncharacterized protein n=1 Tax=Acidihalobacter aeolianus TaxID=2792603 RepID=A0A1D8KCW4_9GAMM|nr:DUF6166 domain-containing protein [Acidihalobacter aeolianus]AOV18774.1 hypothetical protein BJI67_16165 [Acidihalobacter aeolianus]